MPPTTTTAAAMLTARSTRQTRTSCTCTRKQPPNG
jgi:hypothetical protein